MCLGSVLSPRKLTFLPCTYRKHFLFFPIDYAISYRLFIYGPYCIQVSFWSTYFVKRVFIMNGCWILWNTFVYIYWDNHFIPIPKKGNAKECSNYCTIALISYASKVMPKILQARLQQYMNCELSDVQAGFRKGRGIRDQIANICWIIEKAREFQKSTYFYFIDYAKAFDCVDHNILENSERDGNTRPPDLPLEKPVCNSGSNS